MFARWVAVAALLLAAPGCSLHRVHVPPKLIVQPGETPEDTLGPRSTTGYTFTKKFIDSYRLSYDTPGSAEYARDMTRYGMTLVDARCDLFFEHIGRGAQNGDFARRQFQSITAALIAALGLTTVGQDAITGVGIGSALGVQSLDNYSTVFFFSPDVSAVQQLVRRAFTSLREAQLAPTQSPATFEAAVAALRTYQNVCTAHEIKRLVTQAIDQGQTVAQFGGDDAPRYAAAADRALDRMGKALGGGTLDLRQAVLLRMLVGGPAGVPDTITTDYICAALDVSLRGKVCVPGSETVAVAGGGSVTLATFVRRNGAPSAEAMEALRAGWSTLDVLIEQEVAGETGRQAAVVKQSAADRRGAEIRIAELNAAKLRAENEGAERQKELQARLDEARRDAAAALLRSPVVSSPLLPASPPTGVAVDGVRNP